MVSNQQNNMIEITVNNKNAKRFPKGSTLEMISKEYQDNSCSRIIAAIVGNELKELSASIDGNCDIRWVDACSSIGSRIYKRSLTFVFIRACMELYSGCQVNVEHSINKGLYCEVKYKKELQIEDSQRIYNRMKEIIEEDVPFEKRRVSVEEAIDIFKDYTQMSKVKLLKYREKPYIKLYQCGWLKNYFYGYMVPSTGYLKEFNLQYYPPGFVLQYPRNEEGGKIPDFVDNPKIFKVFRESEKWAEILQVDYVASLNDLIVSQKEDEYIRIAEALHEKKIAQMADYIAEDLSHRRLILIAGPSSSGKTSLARRLSIQLRVNGLKPKSISLDDYFVDREKTPLDENGEYNFEAIEAIDLNLFNKDLKKILSGEMVEIPTFNFKTGKREYRGKSIQIDKDQPLILEGIHALNDRLTESVERNLKFKIYISCLTQLNIDEHNRIPTTDARLIRRMVRDHQFRGNDALRTMSMWPSVRRGEEAYIFPFQEDADVMFNSALFYELSVLKKYAEPLLRQIDRDSPQFPEAKRLLKFLSYFVVLENEDDIPKTSILREFIGNGAF
ncbi:nucleoside kinase [Tindallia californiensis]|uniref:Uridine kinase n=1 Tax=Tindallia californiensis TaxID=159292 RepID=A0A1H3IAK5_9FIRM|nr:nucleoside kinase [Tindallia californiensis]SDY24737.1 uridine kinase [Tindallia californiensis]